MQTIVTAEWAPVGDSCKIIISSALKVLIIIFWPPERLFGNERLNFATTLQ